MSAIDINIINNPNYDISYVEYNRDSIPWKINTSYICQDNQNYRDGVYSEQFVNISNNLIIESSQNNIVLSTSRNNRVDVNNNMKIGNNLDVSNNIRANNIVLKDISLTNILYVSPLTQSRPFNIIGNVNIDGNFTFRSTLGGNSSFSFATITNSSFTGGIINTTDIFNSKLITADICNSTINSTSIGNLSPSTGAFTDIISNTLLLDKRSGNLKAQIQFKNTNDDTQIITIQENNESKLDINRHLNIGSNDPLGTSFFNGNINCDKLTYKRLDPDICLNNYTNVSFGNFTVSGNIIPTINMLFNIGSNNNKFNNIYSINFIGDLNGNSSTSSLASNLVKNLDMSFNNLDVNGITNSRNIIPFINNTSTLGNANKIWKNAYITDLSVNNKIDISGDIKCNAIVMNGKSYTQTLFDTFLNTTDVSGFIFNDVRLKNNIVFDNSNNNYIFFKDLYQSLSDFSNGILDGSAVSITSKTFNTFFNFYYKLEISGFTTNDISFNFIYNDNVLQTHTLTNTNIFSSSFFTNKKYPVLFLYNSTSSKVIIATQNSNLKSITINSGATFTAKLYKLYAKPKGLSDALNIGYVYTTSQFYYNGNATGVNSKATININDLYYTDKIGDNSNNIRIGTGLLNNASNQILIGNYSETLDRSGNNVILGNSYCEAWLPPQGYTTDLGSSNYPFKSCYLSENLDVSGEINSKSIIPSLNNTFTLGDTSKFWKNAYITDLSVNGTLKVTGATTTSDRINVDAFNRGDFISVGTNTTDRYGIGQYDTGAMRIFTSNTNNTASVRISKPTSNNKDTNCTFTDLLTVLNNGNVGIGTTSPGYKLDVSGATNITGQISAGDRILIDAFDRGDWLSTGSNTNRYGIGQWPNGTMRIFMDNAFGTVRISKPTSNSKGSDCSFNDLLTVLNNGNVGIGTTSPGYKLDVNGTTRATQFTSTVGIGTAPFVVTSTTVVANLRSANADYATNATNQVLTVADTTIANTLFVTNKINSLLGNVTNESKATMFTNPTFTGTVNGVTKSHVGLANVDNTSDINKTVSTATSAALALKANLASPTFTGTVKIEAHGADYTYFNYLGQTSDLWGNYIRGPRTFFQCPIYTNNRILIDGLNRGDFITAGGGTDRYGIGQYDGGIMRIFFSNTYNGSVRISRPTTNSQEGSCTFTDLVTVASDKTTFNTPVDMGNNNITNCNDVYSKNILINIIKPWNNSNVAFQCPIDMGNNNITNAGEIYLKSGSFLRIYGNGGVYWETHQGGWHMEDGNTIKAWGNKNISTEGNVTCNTLYVNEIICKNDSSAKIYFENARNNQYSVKAKGLSRTNNVYEYKDGYLISYLGSNDFNSGWLTSDDRLKQNESNIINSLSLIRKLQPQTYDMTTEFYDASYIGTISGEYKHRAGFIAQKIRAIEEISYCCIGEEYDSSNNPTALQIDYNTIFTYNVAATQELDTLLKEQQTKITILENENISIKNDYTILKNTLNNLLIELGKNTI